MSRLSSHIILRFVGLTLALLRWKLLVHVVHVFDEQCEFLHITTFHHRSQTVESLIEQPLNSSTLQQAQLNAAISHVIIEISPALSLL